MLAVPATPPRARKDDAGHEWMFFPRQRVRHQESVR